MIFGPWSHLGGDCSREVISIYNLIGNAQGFCPYKLVGHNQYVATGPWAYTTIKEMVMMKYH